MTEERDPTLCPCGEGAHYRGEKTRDTVRMLCSEFGPTISVDVPDGGGRYAVPRAYIFLHGFRAVDVPDLAARYGFERLDDGGGDG